MESLRLDRKGIQEYQRNRDPYLLIDFAEEVIPGVSAKGYKDLSEKDWFFECHWPGDPNMPGMLQIEALVQMCALTFLTLPGNKGKVVCVTSVLQIFPNFLITAVQLWPMNRCRIK
jgi:3-hydroxyacyl-[acyl-carrier-protein] dehydratase